MHTDTQNSYLYVNINKKKVCDYGRSKQRFMSFRKVTKKDIRYEMFLTNIILHFIKKKYVKGKNASTTLRNFLCKYNTVNLRLKCTYIPFQ